MKVSELKKWPRVYDAFVKNVDKYSTNYDSLEDFLSSENSEEIIWGFNINSGAEGWEFWIALYDDEIEEAMALQPHLFEEELDSEGFILWNGGEMPVPEGTMVHVKYRNGRKSIVTAGLCDSDETFMQIWGHFTAINWDINSLGSDIVAYKLHTGDGYVDGVKVDKGTPKNIITACSTVVKTEFNLPTEKTTEDFKLNTRKSLNKLAVQGLITGDTISKFDELLKEI